MLSPDADGKMAKAGLLPPGATEDDFMVKVRTAAFREHPECPAVVRVDDVEALIYDLFEKLDVNQ